MNLSSELGFILPVISDAFCVPVLASQRGDLFGSYQLLVLLFAMPFVRRRGVVLRNGALSAKKKSHKTARGAFPHVRVCDREKEEAHR